MVSQLVFVEAHPVDEARALLEQTREAEVEQAAHRARPVRRPCEIDLVSIVGIDLTVDETLDWDEWLSEGDIVSLSLALPETITALARVVSDVCGDRKTVEYYFRQNPGARRDFDAALMAVKAVRSPYNSIYTRRFHRIRSEAELLPLSTPWRLFRCRVSGNGRVLDSGPPPQ
jgi:hypothetical protein